MGTSCGHLRLGEPRDGAPACAVARVGVVPPPNRGDGVYAEEDADDKQRLLEVFHREREERGAAVAPHTLLTRGALIDLIVGLLLLLQGAGLAREEEGREHLRVTALTNDEPAAVATSASKLLYTTPSSDFFFLSSLPQLLPKEVQTHVMLYPAPDDPSNEVSAQPPSLHPTPSPRQVTHDPVGWHCGQVSEITKVPSPPYAAYSDIAGHESV